MKLKCLIILIIKLVQYTYEWYCGFPSILNDNKLNIKNDDSTIIFIILIWLAKGFKWQQKHTKFTKKLSIVFYIISNAHTAWEIYLKKITENNNFGFYHIFIFLMFNFYVKYEHVHQVFITILFFIEIDIGVYD